MKFGSITTGIIADGLIFNMDAANKASYPKTGTIIFDTKNLSHSGSLESDTIFNSNPPNFEFGLDGVDDYIEFNSAGSVNGEILTISIWYYTTNGNQSGAHQLVSKTASSFEVYQFGTTIWTYIGGKYPIGTKIPAIANNWTNVTFTIIGDIQYSYQNGILDKTNTLNDPPDFSAGSALTIGKRSQATGASGQYWEGSIASVQLYNRPLSANEVLHNYNALKGRFGY